MIEHNNLHNTGFYYIDMELCDVNLQVYIQSHWPPPPDGLHYPPNGEHLDLVWDIMQDIVFGLTFIHSKGLVHRDLKPENGSSNPVRLTDYSAVFY